MTDFSFQLYSARKFPPVEAILPRLKALGYAQVEGYAGMTDDPAGFGQRLKASGLTMPTAHFSVEVLRDREATLRTAKAFGVQTIICPWIKGGDEAVWEANGELLAGFAATYESAGFDFGYHNHNFEFVPTSSGRLPMDILLEAAPTMNWEVDVAWMIKGNQAPFDWFDRYGKRVTAIHVKDIALDGESANEDGWADVGYGTIDWPSLFAEIRKDTSAKYFVMEHDNPSDADRFARRSIETAKKWK